MARLRRVTVSWRSESFCAIRVILCPRCVPRDFRGARWRVVLRLPVQRPLTDAFVRSVKPPASGRLEISDMRCAGLALRITPNGVKSWAFRFRDRTTGRPGRATIGQYPAVGLTAARASADAMRRDVANGINPAARKQQDRATAGAKAFGALAERYLIEHARRHSAATKATSGTCASTSCHDGKIVRTLRSSAATLSSWSRAWLQPESRPWQIACRVLSARYSHSLWMPA